MKIRKSTVGKEDTIELQMTPMIDIVFQLLVFFVMTFKIVSQEGDFNIRMPLAAPREGLPDEDLVPPIKVRLTADQGGGLAGIRLNDRSYPSWDALQNKIISLLEGDPGMRINTEVELDCDYALKYENVVAAITAVSGYRDGNNEIVKLVQLIALFNALE